VKTSATATVRFQSATPQFTVPDVVQTAEFYRDVLGFEILGYWDGARVSMRAQPAPVFGIVRRDSVQIFFSRADGGDVRTGRAEGACDAYIQVTAVDLLAEELGRRGATILDSPEDRIYKQRELVVQDCNGLVLVFAEDTSGRAA
jgi:catechol 2,3-dioxygenase-like lactoylglutathione lyase family enzyme